VTEPLSVGAGSAAEGRDLVQALEARGFSAALVRKRSRWEVEIGLDAHEGDRLLLDVVRALEVWLVGRGRRSVRVRVGERSVRLTAHPDEAERSQASAGLVGDLLRQVEKARRRGGARSRPAPREVEGLRRELVCASCGYGISVIHPPNTCPMCHRSAWEQPTGRSRRWSRRG